MKQIALITILAAAAFALPLVIGENPYICLLYTSPSPRDS